MDWARAIERNSEALEGIIATLVAMLEQAGGAAAARLPRAVYRTLLSLLRPAEVRRLIVIAALGLTVKPTPARPRPARPIPRGKGEHLAFPLLDPRKDFSTLSFAAPTPSATPRIRVFGYDPRVIALFAATPPQSAAAPAASPSPTEESVDARRLALRIAALKAALANLPRQARRLVRWRARLAKKPAPKFKSPLRPGRPPGQRRPPKRDIDFVLAECHALAVDAQRPNTS